MKTVDAYLDAIPRPELLELAASLRALILHTVPAFEENIKWSAPCYSIGGKNACYIMALKDSVNFGFYMGTSLADPHKLLKGTGTNLRHIKLKTLEDLEKPGLTDLIKESARFAANA